MCSFEKQYTDPVTGIVYTDDGYQCPLCGHTLDRVKSGSGIYGYNCPICDTTYNKEDIESW
jgi:ssDNA-binding Zn-finger/Zn-ribbon topoisomerase 1